MVQCRCLSLCAMCYDGVLTMSCVMVCERVVGREGSIAV